MFSTTNFSKVTVVCVAAMMMMMVMMFVSSEAASVSKHSTKTRNGSSDGVASHTVRLHLDPDTFTPTRHIRPLQNSSISPWTYKEKYDEALFPDRQSEAQCLLQGCLDSQGQEDMSLRSKPIMHQVLQLRRVRTAGAEPGSVEGYHYRLETRVIAVGCTCVRPFVKRQE